LSASGKVVYKKLVHGHIRKVLYLIVIETPKIKKKGMKLGKEKAKNKMNKKKRKRIII